MAPKLHGHRCVVCGKRKRNFKHLKYHFFPRDKQRCMEWIKKINVAFLETKSHHQLTTSHVVCSNHFSEDQYTETGRLKPTATPVIDNTELVYETQTILMCNNENNTIDVGGNHDAVDQLSALPQYDHCSTNFGVIKYSLDPTDELPVKDWECYRSVSSRQRMQEDNEQDWTVSRRKPGHGEYDNMAGELVMSICFVCKRRLTGSRSVQSSARLRHSGLLVSEVVRDLLDSELVFSKLCFRCYRLTLGIDYHKQELKKLKEEFFKLYNERHISHYYVEGIDKSRQTNIHDSDEKRVVLNTTATEDGVKEQLLCENLSESTLSSDHVYYKSMNNRQHRNTGYMEKEEKMLESCESESVVNSSPCDNIRKITTEVQEHSRECSDVLNYLKYETDNNNRDTAVKNSENSPGKESPKQSSKRRKRAKKLEDFEYYAEDGKALDPKSLQNFDKFVTENASNVVTYSKIYNHCNSFSNDFTDKKVYSSHECFKKEKKRDITYKCKGCQKLFTLRRDYIRHIESCYKNVPVSCHICMVKLPSAAYLPRHLKSFHKVSTAVNEEFLCDQCGRGFSRKEALERHQAQVHHLAHGIHQCPQCGRTFPHTSLLAEHLRAHKGYLCTECNKTFSCMSNLKLHKRAHHQNKAAYRCTRCNKCWKFHASYTYHMRKFHGPVEHKCPKCKSLFSSESSLEQHKYVCITDEEKPGSSTTLDVIINDESDTDIQTKITIMEEKEVHKNASAPSATSVQTISGKSQSNVAVGRQKSGKTINNPTSNNDPKRRPSGFSSRCVSILNRKNVHQDISTLTSHLTEDYQEHQGLVETNKDTLVFLAPVGDVEQAPLVCQVSASETSSLPSSGEIILETFDDLSSECQYVILVEDGGSGKVG